MKKKDLTSNVRSFHLMSTDHFFELMIKDIDSNQSISPQDRYRAADYVICKDVCIEDETSFCRDYKIIKDAIAAVCSQNYTQAVELVRPVSFDSPFSQWKLFLRGMIAFYMGDDDKVEKNLLKIEPSTVPYEIAASYLVLIDKNKYLKNDLKNCEDALVNSCLLAGYPDYKVVLPKAEVLWTTGRYKESLIHVAKKMSGFPTLEIGMKGDLTNFFFNMPHHIEEDKLDRYISGFNEVIGDFNGKFTLEILLIQRTVSMLNVSFEDQPDNEMLRMWEIFIKAYRSILGENKKIEAEIYLFIGLMLSEGNPENQLPKVPAKRRNKHFGLAEKCLLKSIELNESKDAYLLLLKYYKTNGKKKEYVSLIDRAIITYPNDKELLLEAGYSAFERKSYTKSIEYFEHAHSLDPLDSNLREALISSYIKAALAAVKNKNGSLKMRKFMDRAETLCQTDSKGFVLQLPFVLLRRAALEFYAGNDLEGNRELQRAFATTGNREQLLYFSAFIFRAYEVPLVNCKNIEEEVNGILLQSANLKLTMDFIEVLEYVRNLENVSGVYTDIEKILKYFLNAIESEIAQRSDFTRVFILAEDFGYFEEALRIVKRALRTDPDNLFYSFYDYHFKRKNQVAISPYSYSSTTAKLQRILEAANKKNDQEVISLVNREFVEISSSSSFLKDFPFPLDEKTMHEIGNLINGRQVSGDDFPQRKSTKRRSRIRNKDKNENNRDLF